MVDINSFRGLENKFDGKIGDLVLLSLKRDLKSNEFLEDLHLNVAGYVTDFNSRKVVLSQINPESTMNSYDVRPLHQITEGKRTYYLKDFNYSTILKPSAETVKRMLSKSA